jgi:DNA processing protein
MSDERAAFLALALVPGIGPARLQTLLDACQTSLGALSAPLAFLRAVPGFSRASATAIKAASLADGHRVLDQVQRVGGVVLLLPDAGFPALLRHIPDPPPVLFAQGNLGLLHKPAVAIVGSREHSPYGQEVCRALAWDAARAGVAVVSGMARGLDAAAHGAALDAGGATIGVLANGLGVIYPAANRALYQRVVQQGLLLTEFPPGERPHAGSFPRRNRLISGLARVTVVVEAAIGSGALITAGAALDQGREVMAVPGNITSSVSVGTNRLIRDGATPVLEAADLLQHYADAEPIPLTPAAAALGPGNAALPETLTPEERELVQMIGPDLVLLDDLVHRSGRAVHQLLSTLCSLEIAGIVEQRPGRLFRRV